jgi:transcriptional/translational regulatory protein YebC/TACO1
MVVVDGERYSEDDLMVAIDAGAGGHRDDDDVFEITCEPADLTAVRAGARRRRHRGREAPKVAQLPKTRVELDEEGATKLIA